MQRWEYEERAYQNGYRCIAGIDEAGRGPLAGSVVAAACILPLHYEHSGVNDSKKLSPKKREELFEQLTNDPLVSYGLGVVSAKEIDRINIYQATIVAMQQAVNQLFVKPDYLLVDGLLLPFGGIQVEKVIRGDSLSYSIGAASIIAKVTRDRMMLELDQKYPQYGFAKHKGYGTKQHLQMLEEYGSCFEHRKSFRLLDSQRAKQT